MKRAYHGFCHCKAITFTAVLDLSKGSVKCNCRLCWKQRMWKTDRIDVADFSLVAEPGRLGGFMGKHQGEHHFSNSCGIATHTHVRRPDAGEEYVMVHVASLHDLPVDDLLAAPLTIVDGLHDQWSDVPAQTRHL